MLFCQCGDFDDDGMRECGRLATRFFRQRQQDGTYSYSAVCFEHARTVTLFSCACAVGAFEEIRRCDLLAEMVEELDIPASVPEWN